MDMGSASSSNAQVGDLSNPTDRISHDDYGTTDCNQLNSGTCHAIRKELAKLLDDPSHDDGSWGPLFIRLAWHCSGTYSCTSNNGGSDGFTMRFDAERNDPENAGVWQAVERIISVRRKFPWVSRADLVILAAYVAIEVRNI